VSCRRGVGGNAVRGKADGSGDGNNIGRGGGDIGRAEANAAKGGWEVKESIRMGRERREGGWRARAGRRGKMADKCLGKGVDGMGEVG